MKACAKADYPVPSLSDETVFEDIYKGFIDEAKESGVLDLYDIVDLITMLQEHELDCHVVVAGQNGVGKSYVMLMLLKIAAGGDWMEHLMLARHTTNDLIQYILNNNRVICGIDELNQYLYYTHHASFEQDHLITTLELARSKSIGFIGCIRDPRKISLNYRDGKMSVVIWVMDRFKEGGAIAAVFVTNPVIESFDKFGFASLPGDVVDFDEMRALFEELPSFVGYIKVPHIKYMFKDGELKRYKSEKETAMAHAHLNYCIRQVVKKYITPEEFKQELDRLSPILGHEVTDAARVHIPRKRMSKNQSSMNRFM